jgi:uncharacterized Tic20 family protein
MGSEQLASLPTARERVWATFCHLAALTPLLGIPLGLIVGPLAVWLIKKDESPFVNRHGKAALNFQISIAFLVLLVAVVGFLYVCVLAPLGPHGRHLSVQQLFSQPPPLWAVLLPAGRIVVLLLVPFDLICVIVGAVWANKGREYRYPLAIPFIR